MNSAELQQLLGTVRGAAGPRSEPEDGRGATSPPPHPFPPECLSFERTRALALDPGRWRAEERRHTATCRRCRRLVASAEVQMPHLSLWTLLRHRLGSTSERERQAIAYHLEEGGCRRCRQVAGALAVGTSFRLPPFALPHPAAAGAATGALEVGGRSSDGRLEAELVEEERQILLEIRSREAALNHQMIAYTLRGAQQEMQGFLVLRPDVERWYAAQEIFDPELLYSRLQGRCEEVLIAPVGLEALPGVDRELLLAEAGRSRGNAEARAAWAAWASSRADVSEETRRLLDEVRAAVGG